jgi:hypothetical protein
VTRADRCTRRKTYPSVVLSTTNSTWTDLGPIPGLFKYRLGTNSLPHSRAYNLWSCISTSPYVFMARCLSKQMNNFAFGIQFIPILLPARPQRSFVPSTCSRLHIHFAMNPTMLAASISRILMRQYLLINRDRPCL